MPPPLPVLTQEGEDAWLRLRRHLELCDHFALVFIFSAHPLVLRVFRERLAQLYRATISGMEIPLPAEPDRLVLELLWQLLRPSVRMQALKAPYWLDLSGKLGEDWEKARINFLLRLNERREPLRRGLNQPLIMVLPLADQARIWSIAPDLWSIREFSITTASWTVPEAERAASLAGLKAEVADYPPEIESEYDQAILREWRRVKDKPSTDHGIFLAGWRAYEVYDKFKRHDQARETAAWLLNFVQQQIERIGETPGSLRLLSASLNNVGNTALALGQWAEARRSYEESLNIARKIIERIGETPESLHDLSVSLEKIGNTANALGEWDEARRSYGESLDIDRKIIKRIGETPESLRGLSVSLSRVGDVASALGQWAEARRSYKESLDTFRKIIERIGETPEVLRDLSVSLIKVGDVANALGELNEARWNYEESLGIFRKIIERIGETPESLRDLSVALIKIGDTTSTLGELDEARRNYEEGLGIVRKIIERIGETPQSLHDLAVSLDKMGEATQALGELDTARRYYEESLAIIRKIIERFGETPRARDDLAEIVEMIEQLDKNTNVNKPENSTAA